jgi:hypothetical protein
MLAADDALTPSAKAPLVTSIGRVFDVHFLPF